MLEALKLEPDVLAHIEEDIKSAETELDDDAESIISNERYIYIADVIKACYKKKRIGELTTSDKIDRIIEVINGVSFSKNRGKKPATIEGCVVQDADRLDAFFGHESASSCFLLR